MPLEVFADFFSFFLFLINCRIILQSSARHWKLELYNMKAKEKWLTKTEEHHVALSVGFLWTLARLSIGTVLQYRGRFILVWFIWCSHLTPNKKQRCCRTALGVTVKRDYNESWHSLFANSLYFSHRYIDRSKTWPHFISLYYFIWKGDKQMDTKI